MQPFGATAKLGGHVGNDEGGVGSVPGPHAPLLHGVGSGAGDATGNGARASGPVAARVIRQGSVRSAVAPAAWITKWNQPRAGQPTSGIVFGLPVR